MTALPAHPAQDLADVVPHDPDAENYVLGAILLSEHALTAVQTAGLQARHFYYESNGRIYATALKLHREGVPVDVVTLADRLRQTGTLDEVGGRDRVMVLAAIVPAAGNAPYYARIVIEAAQRRDEVRLGYELVKAGRGAGLAADRALLARLGKLVDARRGLEEGA